MSDLVDNKSSQSLQKLRRRYLPFHQVHAGMVLGEPLTLTERHIVRFTLPAGHILTDENLQQMAAHHAEFVCMAEPDARSEEEIARDTRNAATRVQEIFAHADLSEPILAALYERVLAYRTR